MRKKIRLALIAAVLIGSALVANAASFRVNSKGGAHFRSVAEALATTLSSQYYVQSGDTLYAEPGHVEPSNVIFNKKIIIIGPGYNFAESGYNVMNAESAVFKDINMGNSSAHFSEVHGCIADNIDLGNYCVANRCRVNRSICINGDGFEITNCYTNKIQGFNDTYTGSKIIGNIVKGYFEIDYHGILSSATIANNVIVCSRTEYLLCSGKFHMCNIYNNIIINTNTNLVQAAVDTVSRYSNYTIHPDLLANNSIHHNVLSTVQCPGSNSICNVATNIYDATIETVFVNNGLMEGQYELKTGSPAIGAGSAGTDCGAFGGSQPYVKGGQPGGVPYIYDATFTTSGNNDNTINANFKVRIAQ